MKEPSNLILLSEPNLKASSSSFIWEFFVAQVSDHSAALLCTVSGSIIPFCATMHPYVAIAQYFLLVWFIVLYLARLYCRWALFVRKYRGPIMGSGAVGVWGCLEYFNILLCDQPDNPSCWVVLWNMLWWFNLATGWQTTLGSSWEEPRWKGVLIGMRTHIKIGTWGGLPYGKEVHDHSSEQLLSETFIKYNIPYCIS